MVWAVLEAAAAALVGGGEFFRRGGMLAREGAIFGQATAARFRGEIRF